MMYKHLEQFFKDNCILSVWCITQPSLAQHIVSGPVRHIVGITFASGSRLRSYTMALIGGHVSLVFS